MHIKHLAYGVGSAARAADYLLQDKDHKGELREAVEILIGDPRLVADVADSLDTKWKYTSGVIAWHPEDKPSTEQIEAVLAEYEQTAFAGLEPDRYCFSAILHHEASGHLAVHTFAARVELETGKSYNPAPPGHMKIFDLVRDKWNVEQGWKSPDPTGHGGTPSTRERTPDLGELYGKQNKPKEVLHSWIMERINAGVIENRADIRASLEEVGTISREGKDYISVKLKEGGKTIRLKGGVYNEQFNRTAAIEAATGDGLSGPAREQKLANLRAELNKALENRAEYNLDRYGSGFGESAATDPRHNSASQKRYGRAHGSEQRSQDRIESGRGAGSEGDNLELDSVDNHSNGSLADYLRESVGFESILQQSVDRPEPTCAANQGSAPVQVQRLHISPVTKWRRDSDVPGWADRSSAKLSPEQLKRRLANRFFHGHVDLEAICWVDLDHNRIQFADGGHILIATLRLSAVGMTDSEAATRFTVCAIASGWQSVELSGSNSFIYKAGLESVGHGIDPRAKDPRQQRQIDKARSDYECFRAAIGEADPIAESRTSRTDQAIWRSHSAVSKAVDKTSLADRKIKWTCGRREGRKEKVGEIFDRLEQFRVGFSRQVSELSFKTKNVVSSYLKLQ